MGLEDMAGIAIEHMSRYLLQEITTRSRESGERRRGLFSYDDDPPAPARSDPPPQAGGGASADSGCPACRLHREAAEARGLLEGLASACEDGGGIPKGLGGTIPLARSCYVESQTHLRSIAIAAPALKENCVSLSRAAADLEQQLKGSVAPDDMPMLATRAQRFWIEAYTLAHAYFTGPQGH